MASTGAGRSQSAFVPSSKDQQVMTSSAVSGAQPSRPRVQITVGARCTIAQDTDIRGTVRIGDQTVVHPKAVIQALDESGSIVIGARCIIEELAQIVHRGPGQMVIGDQNLFEVGCRVEARRVGSHNTFSCKSRTTDEVVIQDFSTVGAGCVAEPPLTWEPERAPNEDQRTEADDVAAAAQQQLYTFPSRSVIYGERSRVRLWSGNGVQQADALHAKHLDHLRRNIPEYHKLRII